MPNLCISSNKILLILWLPLSFSLYFIGIFSFGQTFYLHRYSAHKMFTMNKFWEKFWYIYTWVTQGTSYLNARAYAILHRMHHAYSDTEKDPHTPHFFKEVFTMMWHTKKVYHGVLRGTMPVEQKFDKNFPVYPIIDKIADSWITRIFCTSIYYILLFLCNRMVDVFILTNSFFNWTNSRCCG